MREDAGEAPVCVSIGKWSRGGGVFSNHPQRLGYHTGFWQGKRLRYLNSTKLNRINKILERIKNRVNIRIRKE